VTLEAADGAREEIAARTVVWAAGVRASALAAVLADATGASLDSAGRVAVGPDLTLPGRAAAHASSPAATGGRPPA